MSNPLYQQFQAGNAMGQTVQHSPVSNMQSMIQRFNQFVQAFTGDPRQQVQNLLNSGRITQTQYNQAFQTAKQLEHILRGK